MEWFKKLGSIQKNNEENGRIIVLNGTSSCGKSSIAKKLQSLIFNNTGEVYLNYSSDNFVSNAPNELFSNDEVLVKNLTKFARAFHSSLAAIAADRINLIIDHVFHGENWYKDFNDKTKNFNVLFVKINCPLLELTKREEKRKNRTSGLASYQFSRVHKGVNYNLEIDTSKMTPKEAADSIFNFLQKIK